MNMFPADKTGGGKSWRRAPSKHTLNLPVLLALLGAACAMTDAAAGNSPFVAYTTHLPSEETPVCITKDFCGTGTGEATGTSLPPSSPLHIIFKLHSKERRKSVR